MRGERGHQTGQESRSARSRDTLGLEVRNDVGKGAMRWITVGPPDQPGTSVVLDPPAAHPGVTDDERRTIAEMMVHDTEQWHAEAARTPMEAR